MYSQEPSSEQMGSSLPHAQQPTQSDCLTIRVDADACPVGVRRTVERVARRKHLPLVFYIDENHELSPGYGTVRQVGQGHDAVDLVLINQLNSGDLVITQDYGLAALVLARRAMALHPTGRVYTDDNIDRLLLERHLSAKARKAGQRLTNARRRRPDDDHSFQAQLHKILDHYPDRY